MQPTHSARSRPQTKRKAPASKPKPKLDELAVEIRILNGMVAKLTMRDLEQRISAVLPGVSLLQYGVMRMLSHQPRTLSELSAHMMLTPSTLVPAVDKLEREEWVVRSKDPSDRRRTPLILTEAAQRALDTVPPSDPNDLIVRAVSEMDSEQALQLRGLLHTLLLGMSADKAMIEAMLENHPERKCLFR